ncbi:hypothetical protein O3P69_011675 [Scylla paramamosain]|uniref:Uncharacterized protein n=1 Tax=Scylla paramamosain TaxID=85552 RepID=A0AAW0SGA2_SCYPA
MRRRPQELDGTVSWEAYKTQFELLASARQWSRPEMAMQLVSSGVSATLAGSRGTPRGTALQGLSSRKAVNGRAGQYQGRGGACMNTTTTQSCPMLVEGNKAAMAFIPEVYDGHTLSQDGLTPLHAAALCGAPSDAVEALLRRGVSPHVTTPGNMTPADLARQQGQDSVIKGLQRHHCVQQLVCTLLKERAKTLNVADT